MGQIEFPPLENPEAGEGAEDNAARKLDDATLEPRAIVEQTGDFKQSEAIQISLETVMVGISTAPAAAGMLPSELVQAESVSGRQPDAPAEGPFAPAPAESATDGKYVTPVNIPVPGPGQVEGDPARTILPGHQPGPQDGLGDQATAENLLEGQGSVQVSPPGLMNLETAVKEVNSLQPGTAPGEPLNRRPEASLPGGAPHAGQQLATSLENTPPEAGLKMPEVSLNEAALGEAEEIWIPPEMYKYVGADGKITVVDANGKPVGSPPTITSAAGVNFYAYYPGVVDKAGNPITFEIKDYKGSLADVYLYQDSSGQQVVVDANGKPVESQPQLTSPDGATFYASYAGGYKTGDMVQLQAYKGSLADVYLY